MPDFPVFGQEEFDSTRRKGCADDSCNIHFILSTTPPATIFHNDGDGCCDCPPGPQGPPGPKGDRGDSGSTECGTTYGGPLLPPDEDGINQKAFDNLLGSKGYIVALAGSEYNIDSLEADVITHILANQAYIDPSSGNPADGTITNITTTKEIYPIAYRTVGATGNTYDTYNPTFEQFLEMCGLRDQSNNNNNPNHYLSGPGRKDIPSLLAGRDGGPLYTFISSDSSATESANGPYLMTQFKSNVQGVVDGTLTHEDVITDNPKIRTDLGEQIVKADGSIGVAYDNCESCIGLSGDENKLTDSGALGGCDEFIDTENGVLYTRDKNGNYPDGNATWPSGAPRFNTNGIPLRRKPVIPEPRIKKKDEIILGQIIQSIGIGNAAPFFKWKYKFVKVINFVNGAYTTAAAPEEEFAYNGAEYNDDIQGIGEGIFDNFQGVAEMLPIRTDTIVMMKRFGDSYYFDMPNAYKVGCE